MPRTALVRRMSVGDVCMVEGVKYRARYPWVRTGCEGCAAQDDETLCLKLPLCSATDVIFVEVKHRRKKK